MGEAEKDLTSRYYAAEVTSGLLGGILLVARYFGITPDQPLPLLNVTLDTSLAYVRIVAILLIATMLYLFVEWTQSSRAARETLGSSIRLLAAICWTVVTLWLSYPILSHGTRFAGISPVWYLGFVSIGLLLGTFVDVVASSCLMIRSPEESKRLRLPRIPAATRAQFVMYTPVIILLLIAYFVLHRFTPSQIGVLATLLAMISVLLVILVELASLCPRRDENGQSISYAKKIA